MRAITQRAFGGPDVLELVDVARPEPGPGEVLVAVSAVGVNPADWKLRSGQVRRLGDPPFTLGFDVRGVVEQVGGQVTDFRPGDEVYGMVFQRLGGYAEYIVAPVDVLAPAPRSVDRVRAAALPTAALTAFQALDSVVAGQRVLVHAAAGGVGHLAVQIAKTRGAYVLGTARAANHDFLRGLGADELIDYSTVDFGTTVRDVNVVLDLIGGEYGSRSLPTLKPDGRLVDVVG
ncbi:MAG TPA: NADP-dependent oxidoreductase, partial [Pseudonocardiaceae bacterium]|nr:NADP-dependent oxidoreductase [Pseudonocardiaceae bacterium]